MICCFYCPSSFKSSPARLQEIEASALYASCCRTLIVKCRYEHFIQAQKLKPEPTKNTWRETKPKIYKYLLGSKLFYLKEPEPKRTDLNRSGPKKNRFIPDFKTWISKIMNFVFYFLYFLLWFSWNIFLLTIFVTIYGAFSSNMKL